MAVNGFFLGGMAEGIASGRQQELKRDTFEANKAAQTRGLDLQERSVGLQAKALERKQEMDQVERANKLIESNMTAIKDTVISFKAAGKTPEEIAKFVKPLMDDISAFSKAAGTKPDSYINQVQALLAGPSPTETAIAAGAASAGKKVAEAKSLEGVGVAKDSALESAGIKTPNITLKTFKVGDKLISVRADDSAGIQQALDAGGVETPLSVRASDLSGLDLTTRPNKASVAEARKNVSDLTANLGELNATIEAFKKTPEAGGISGLLIEKAAGLAEQIPLGIGEKVIGMVGVDTEAVASARTQARLTVSRLLETVTGDEGNRFTKEDRQLAEQVQGTLDPKASPKQIHSALKTVVEIMQRSRARNIEKLRVAADISVEDLGSDGGIEKMVEILMKNGMTEDQAVAEVVKTRERLGVTKQSPTR